MTSGKRDNRPPYLDFGLELERARRGAALSVKDLAAAVCWGPRTVRRYLNGERLPTLETTELWERACNLEPGRLTRMHPEALGAQSASAVGEGRTGKQGPGADPDKGARDPNEGDRGRRRVLVLGTAGLALLAAVAVLVKITVLRGSSQVEQTVKRAERLKTTYDQVTGGPARTWSDYRIAGGDAGTSLGPRQRVKVTCRVRGFKVNSGNEWWYLLASPPWRNEYFATADAFFNQDPIEGVDFTKTRLVDPRVPECP